MLWGRSNSYIDVHVIIVTMPSKRGNKPSKTGNRAKQERQQSQARKATEPSKRGNTPIKRGTKAKQER